MCVNATYLNQSGVMYVSQCFRTSNVAANVAGRGIESPLEHKALVKHKVG